MTQPRYQLIRPLSAGGSGRVWLAEDTHQDGLRVAMKQLHDGVAVDILSREFDALRRMRHPNVANVFDFHRGEEGEAPYLTEEFIDGADLMAATEGLTVKRRGRLLAQVLRGLEYVHAQGLVHGDVKPENILVTHRAGVERACLIDFGLVASSGEHQSGMAGTAPYIAPEVIREQPRTLASDLYSLGVTIYEVLTRRRPFGQSDVGTLLRAHLEETPQPPSAVAPDLPPLVDRLVMRLLEKVPADRPQSAREVLLELAEALELRLDVETAETLKGYLRSGRMVGRDSVLRTGRRLFGALRGQEDAMHLLWLWGPTGSGRTRLLRELAGDAQIDGAEVVVTRGGEGGPLGPARGWLRGLGRPSNPLAGARDRWEAIERCAVDLIQAAAETEVLIALDDADQADDMTVDLLRVLLDRIAACYAPGSEIRPPRLAIVIAGLEAPEHLSGAHAQLFETAPLMPLTDGELTAWLSRLLPAGSELPTDFVAGVARVTQHHPGHVVALLTAMAERGHLRVEGGEVRVEAEALSAPLPASLREAVAEREARLPEETRAALAVLRTVDQPAPVRLLAAVVGRPEDDVSQCMLNLVERGLVGTVDGPEVLYRAEGSGAGYDDERRRALHSDIARALMGMGGRTVVPGLGMAGVAHHALQAVRLGETRLAAAGFRAALVGADEARTLHAGEGEARALEIAAELAPDDAARTSALLRLGTLLSRLSSFGAAVSAFESALETAGKSPAQRDEALLGLCAVDSDRGDYPRGLERAQAVDKTGTHAAAALAQVARCHLMMGAYDEALTSCDQGLALEPAPEVEAELRRSRALVYYYTERPDEALPEFEASAGLFESAGDPVGRATAVNAVGLIYHRRGAFDEALQAYEESRRIAAEYGARKRIAAATINIGTVLHETGRVVEAAERYRESLQTAELLGDGAFVARAAMNLANLLIYLNRLPEATYWLERSTQEAQAHQSRLVVAYNQGLLGKVRHHEGDLEGARRLLAMAVSELREMGNTGEAGELFIELGLVARSASDVEALNNYAAATETAAQQSGAEKQMAWALFLRGEAARIAGRAAEGIEKLREALTHADRHRLLDLGWLCEAGLARCFREQGNAMEARARFQTCSERIFTQAAALSGRDRDLFLSDRERAKAVAESRLAMNDAGTTLPSAQREGREQLLRMMEINRRLASQRDLPRLLELILDAAIDLTGAERGFILLIDDPEEPKGQFEVQAARNIDRESLRKNRSKLSQSITREVLDTGEPIITVDAGEDVRFREASSVHHLKLRSILCFPLRVHGRVIGAIYLDNRFQSSTFSDREAQVIASFADQAAVAIENAYLHEKGQRTQQQLKAQAERIEALNKKLEARVNDQAARLMEIESSLKMQRTQLETRYSYDNIIGSSTAMHRVFSVLDRVTDTSVPVLVEGESGTGKELVARAIHYNGPTRRNRPFVSVNCAALTETLLESELFGHVKGAFTGADRDRKGLFEVADGGTLFLDEVADMSLPMQAKLLRALQEGEIWPVGAPRAIHVDVRIVAACNRDLDEMVKSKEFRQDLYFRLNVVKILLPPLRHRGDDLVMLVQHFLTRFKEKHDGRDVQISQAALDRLLKYPWPGNVRELESTLMNACLFCDTGMLSESHFTHKPELFENRPAASRGTETTQPARLSGDLLDLGDMSLRELEEKAILAALERTGGNKVEAAKRLGITRQTLYNKLKSLRIEIRRDIKRA